MANSKILITRGVTKKFGDFTAVHQVDLELARNEALAVIGPNGAGKTTLLNLITGFYLPNQGSVLCEGVDITHLSPAKRVALGIARTFQLVHVFDNLTVFDNVALSYFRRQAGSALPLSLLVDDLQQPAIVRKVKDVLTMMELENLCDEGVGNLPLGSKKRLELAMAFASEPKILVLDEPFAGLGDQEIDEIVTVLKRFRHNKTILVVEHKISKLTEFVDRLAVMHEGEMICCGDFETTLNDPEVRRCYWKV